MLRFMEMHSMFFQRFHIRKLQAAIFTWIHISLFYQHRNSSFFCTKNVAHQSWNQNLGAEIIGNINLIMFLGELQLRSNILTILVMLKYLKDQFIWTHNKLFKTFRICLPNFIWKPFIVLNLLWKIVHVSLLGDASYSPHVRLVDTLITSRPYIIPRWPTSGLHSSFSIKILGCLSLIDPKKRRSTIF